MSTRKNSRAVAAQIVSQWFQTGDFPDRLIESVDENRPFITEVVLGIARHRRMLQWVVERCVPNRPRNDVLACLMVGIYQLLMMDTVAEYAAVNETVEAVKHGRSRSSTGLVNGVLRRVGRERKEITRDIATQPLAIRQSHPDILVQRWLHAFGETGTEELCAWNNTRPSVTLVPGKPNTTITEILDLLRSQGIDAEPHSCFPRRSLVLPHGVRVAGLPGFDVGLFNVQDPSTLVAVDLLDPQSGERVLDACAAPGGKTVAIGRRMGNCGEVVAMDLHDGRLARLRENIDRMGLTSVEVIQGDATGEDIALVVGEEPFDRILLDVPCTNTGVLRRRPDARWRFSSERQSKLVVSQQTMLDHTAALLKPGGVLVYSTCSLEPEEGRDLVRVWLDKHPDFALIESTGIFPPETRSDGIYAASICRKTA